MSKHINNQVPSLFSDDEFEQPIGDWKVTEFSHKGFCDEQERQKIENKYWDITQVTDRFNRQIVSYQLNKKDSLHRWLKYKEGFSAELVRILLNDFEVKEKDVVLDPFMGSGTTALVCCMLGINSCGYDILPMSKVSINSKTAVFDYDVKELYDVVREINELKLPEGYSKVTPYVSITKDGYPEETAKELAYYSEYFENSNHSEIVKNLLKLCFLNTLEPISYSEKKGQYLGWDYRCPKIVAAVKDREVKGRKPFATKLDKGEIPKLKDVLLRELQNVIHDIEDLQKNGKKLNGQCKFEEGSVLFKIPQMEANSVNSVITSPPYCNRYDYTRTYGMELAYLGKTDRDIRNLRQELLSCTVENKTKIDRLRDYYESIGRLEDYNKILSIIRNNKALEEVNSALQARNANGEINNKGVLKMVDGYFTELGFLFAELFRVCKSGAYVAFVNDNVRYAGEVIPVDYLTTNLAEQLGFKAVKIYTLKQQKGNSSQQMAKYGRVALRKSITIWQKPQMYAIQTSSVFQNKKKSSNLFDNRYVHQLSQ